MTRISFAKNWDWSKASTVFTALLAVLLGAAILERTVLSRRSIHLVIRGTVRLDTGESGKGTDIEVYLPGLRRTLRADNRFLAKARMKKQKKHAGVGSPWSGDRAQKSPDLLTPEAPEAEESSPDAPSPTPTPPKAVRVWVPQQDGAFRYHIHWAEDGGFEINLTLSSKREPGSCSLVYRRHGFRDYKSPSFPLETTSGSLTLYGDAPDVILSQGETAKKLPRKHHRK